ncbi:MAG TPA: efflux RND transporter periplasmic adaptor subunit [Thiohalobacter sp.]|nr:efflux RND transporter periplasmic adaptor subunit [Thiohalobacter sp.]
MIKRLIIVLLLLAVLFGGIFGWKYLQMQKMIEQATQPPPPATVAAAEVERQRWQPKLRAVGSLTASQGIDLTLEVAGVVKSLGFDSGQTAAAGQALLQLDASVDRAVLEGLVAQRKLAQLQFERNQRLRRENSVSQADLDAARASLDEATASVAAQRARLDKMTLRAPFAGRLGIRQVDAGQYLTPGDPVVSLQALDPVYADFSLPERYLDDLEPGQTVTLTVQAYPGESFEGTLSALESRIDQGSRQIRVRATLPNPDQRLRPGMFAEVQVWLPEVEEVLTLPRQAVVYNPYGSSVFVIQEQEDGSLTVHTRQVQTGEVRDGRISITRGLQAGDRVVSAGQVKLRNGQAVTIDNSAEMTGEFGK